MNSKELMRLGADLAYLSCGILPPNPLERTQEERDEYSDWYMHDREIPERSDDDILREDDDRERARSIR